jgi:hypothetical protein
MREVALPELSGFSDKIIWRQPFYWHVPGRLSMISKNILMSIKLICNCSARLGELPNFDILHGLRPCKISKFGD